MIEIFNVNMCVGVLVIVRDIRHWQVLDKISMSLFNCFGVIVVFGFVIYVQTD